VGGPEISSEEQGEEKAAKDNGASYDTCLSDEQRDFKDMADYEQGASEGSMCEDRASVGTACGEGSERQLMKGQLPEHKYLCQKGRFGSGLGLCKD
jgi:hypothetical protein